MQKSRLLFVAKWSAFISFLLLLIGTIGVILIDTDEYEFFDPSLSNMVELEPRTSELVELESSKIYIALRIDNSDSNAQLKLINESGIRFDGRSANWLDLPRTGLDDTVYNTVRVFEITKEGSYSIYNEGNNTLWLVDETANQNELFKQKSILIVTLSCCLGVPIGIVALLLTIIGWRRNKKNIKFKIISSSDIEIQNKDADIKIITSMNKVPDPFVEDTKNIIKHINTEEEKDTFWKEWDDE